MNTATIAVLLMLLALFRLVNVKRCIDTATKEQEIKYLEEKLKKARNNKAGSGTMLTALLVVLAVDGYIIYLSISAILSFVK